MAQYNTTAISECEIARQDDGILFALIKRGMKRGLCALLSHSNLLLALLKQNWSVYRPGVYGNISCSLLEHVLGEIERVHSTAGYSLQYPITLVLIIPVLRKFTSAEELPFFLAKLAKPVIPLFNHPMGRVLPNEINLNTKILQIYLSSIIPSICEPGDDPYQHSATVLADIVLLQAMSKRIHYGKVIAETKFTKNPLLYHNIMFKGCCSSSSSS